MSVKINSSWEIKLKEEFEKPYFLRLIEFVRDEYAHHHCFPPGNLIFNAFNTTPFEEVKVVLLGQDPYHEFGQAHGLCFSVNDGVAFPPSLNNIFKEITTDVGGKIPVSGNLTRWAKQGVLLLNATLTVREHEAGSHQHHGWEEFTDAVIKKISEDCNGVVFILWGGYAQSKKALIDEKKHFILCSAHPSPLSAYRGFFGNHHFSRANAYLKSVGKSEITW